MMPVTDLFAATVRGSHKMVARARVCDAFQTGADPSGIDVEILDGDVALNSTAKVRGTIDITVRSDLWPAGPADPVTPYGNEIYVERGVEYGNGRVELVPLGYYRIDAAEQENAPRGEVKVSGSDRMAGILDARLVAPRAFPASTTFDTVVENLILEVYPDARFAYDFTPGDVTLGRSVVVEQDRYDFLADLAASHGKVLYFDAAGVLQIRTPPDPSTPVWDVDHGEAGVLIDMGRELSRDGVYNAVVATGEGADTTEPVRAVARDMNPDSPTYWFGRFGKVPRFYSSPFITTQSQAADAAEKMLRGNLGLPYAVDLTTAPNPALEPLDPVRVTYSDTRPAEVHVIESVSIGLTPAAAVAATTREQTTVLIGVE